MLNVQIRDIVREHGGLEIDFDTLEDSADLFDAGLTSLTTVNLMLAIEDQFDVEFEDDMLVRETFESIDALVAVVQELTGGNA